MAAEKLPAGSLRSKSDFKLLILIKVGPLKVLSLRAQAPQLVPKLSRANRKNYHRFRHRRIARTLEGVSPRFPFFPDQRLRKKAAEKLPDESLRSESDFKLLTLIKVGHIKNPH